VIAKKKTYRIIGDVQENEPPNTIDTTFVNTYVFTDEYAAKSVGRRFAEDLDAADEVCAYAKLPRGFHISTHVGNYSHDWAIALTVGSKAYILYCQDQGYSREPELWLH